jgi:RND family efflux transporter MFP subunit
MKTLITVMAVAAAGCAASGCAEVRGTEQPKAPRPVRAQAAVAAPAQEGVRYSATIEAFEQVQLAFKTSGYVEMLLRRSGADGRLRAAQPGDRVAKGTVLARVRDADYRERVNQGQARLVEGDASLKKARLDLERAHTLFAADSLTKPELDAAQATFDGAEARQAATRADLRLADIALQDCALIAPAAGIILERKIELGSLVGAGTVGFVLGDVSSVKARFGIPDTMIQAVTLGQNIGVIVEATAGSTFSGHVTAIAPAADPQSRVFDVEVTIPNGEGRLRPGMIGTVAIDSAAVQRASVQRLTVPLSAIVKPGTTTGGYAVLVVERQGDHDIARLRRVELGQVVGNGISILSGISAGDRVVVSGATLLTDGEAVRVISD